MALVTACGFAVGCSDDDDIEDVIDERIDDLDIDDDFVVTRSEWNGGFVIFDDDGDAVLTTREFRFNGSMFALADFNGDGFVTDDEWEDTMDELDIDGDDLLDEGEFAPFL